MSFDSILTLGQTALELGLISSLTVLALFLSYSMLNVCDLSTDGCFTLGAVVGATYPAQLGEMREKAPHTFFLVPGYGAQGGGAGGVAPAFDKNGLGAIINSSRGIMCAWQKEKCDEHDYAQAARREAIRMRDEICARIGEIRANG